MNLKENFDNYKEKDKIAHLKGYKEQLLYPLRENGTIGDLVEAWITVESCIHELQSGGVPMPTETHQALLDILLEHDTESVIKVLKSEGAISEKELQDQDYKQIDTFFEQDIESVYKELIEREKESSQNFSLDMLLKYLKKTNEDLFIIFEDNKSYVLKGITRFKVQKEMKEKEQLNEAKKTIDQIKLSPKDLRRSEWDDIEVVRQYYRDQLQSVRDTVFPFQQKELEQHLEKKVQSLHKEWKSQREKWEAQQLKEAQKQLASIGFTKEDTLDLNLDRKELDKRLRSQCVQVLKEKNIEKIAAIDVFVDTHIQSSLKEWFATREKNRAKAQLTLKKLVVPKPSLTDQGVSLGTFEKKYIKTQISDSLVQQLPEYKERIKHLYDVWQQELTTLQTKQGKEISEELTVESQEVSFADEEKDQDCVEVATSQKVEESTGEDETLSSFSTTGSVEKTLQLSEEGMVLAERYGIDIDMLQGVLNLSDLEKGIQGFDQVVEKSRVLRKIMVEKGGGAYLAPAFILCLGKHKSSDAVIESIRKLPNTEDEELYLTQIRNIFALDDQSDLGHVFHKTKAVESQFRKGLTTQLSWGSDSVQSFLKSSKNQLEEEDIPFEEIPKMEEDDDPSLEPEEVSPLEEILVESSDLKDKKTIIDFPERQHHTLEKQQYFEEEYQKILIRKRIEQITQIAA